MNGLLKMIGSLITFLCLAAASYEDIRTHKVSDLIWWIMAPSCLLLIPGSKWTPGLWDLFECLYVIFIQEHIMSRFYGRADSHALSCCMIFMTFAGFGIEGHIIHMSIALLFLTVSQFSHGNIGPFGKLKTPVPFLPYISVSFTLTLAAFWC